MRTLSTYLAALALSLGAALCLAPAQGSPLAGSTSTSTTKTDANDIESPLDVSSATLALKGKDVKITVDTYDPIDPSVLYDNNLIVVRFKTGANKARYVYLIVGGAKLVGRVCTVYLDGSKPSDGCLDLTPSKPTGSSVSVRIPRKKIEPGMTTYKWRVDSFAYGWEGCQGGPRCQDYAPDDQERWFTWKAA
ncbi:MAG: hypothetical protein ABIO16_12360 [Nocardioides sp.]